MMVNSRKQLLFNQLVNSRHLVLVPYRTRVVRYKGFKRRFRRELYVRRMRISRLPEPVQRIYYMKQIASGRLFVIMDTFLEENEFSSALREMLLGTRYRRGLSRRQAL